MAIVKQSSGHKRKRQWSDWLARLVCISAILTLTAAGIACILGKRLDALIIAQQAAEKADQRQQDQTLSAALKAAKSQWGQKQAGLEKALQSAKLKIKAAQAANTKIRKQLVVLQKELAAFNKSGNTQVAEAVGSDEKAPVEAAAQAAASPEAVASSPETMAPEDAASAPVVPASGDGATDTATDVATATTTPPKSSLLAVPDADPMASE
jgi:hypothetical protein